MLTSWGQKFDNLDETDHLNRPWPSVENESILNNLPKEKAPGLDGFTGEFYQKFKEGIIPILNNIFQKIQKDYFPTHSIRLELLSSKSDRDISRKEN